MKSLLSSCSLERLDPECEGRCVYRCGGCGLHHPEVECGGIYYCPNPLCRSVGAFWFRAKLDSYVDNGDRTYGIDLVELLYEGIAAKLDDADIAAARDRMVPFWEGQIGGAA